MDKGISHVLSMSILLYGLQRPIFNSQDKEPYSTNLQFAGQGAILFCGIKSPRKNRLASYAYSKGNTKRFCRRRRWKRFVFHSDFNQNKGLALLFWLQNLCASLVLLNPSKTSLQADAIFHNWNPKISVNPSSILQPV